jgi:RNA polymerase sigma-B factor
MTSSTRDRTEHLLRDAGGGVESATADAVVLLNLGLADGIAGRYAGRGIDRDDLVQVARLGLVKAVQRFRPGLGQSFAGFAAPTIAGEIKRHFRDSGWMVRPPRPLQELGVRIREAEKDLEQSLHRRPTTAEVAAELGVDETRVRAAREAASSFHAVSLDQPAGPDQPWSEIAPPDPDDPFGGVDDTAWLHQALDGLRDRERLVLELRFGEELTQADIAARIGVSQMQVSRILRSTLTRLRHQLASSLDDAA